MAAVAGVSKPLLISLAVFSGFLIISIGASAVVWHLSSAADCMTLLVVVFSSNLLALLCGFGGGWHLRAASYKPPPPQEGQLLHWNPEIQRHGLGDLIRSVNHIAIIVADVGRSCAFYTEIMGFQQIQRPNFDRHGAWLTMGNLELHLIKGVPNAPSGRDLIVSHIALESDYPEQILEKLIEMNIPFRQNVSVPDPAKARENLVESFAHADGKVTQFFIRDPDGYYLELCNCEILTNFCLFQDEGMGKTESFRAASAARMGAFMESILGTYLESGQAPPLVLRCPQLFKVGVVVCRSLRRVRRNLRMSYSERLEEALRDVHPASEPDAQILVNLMQRQKTYFDPVQGFSKEELADAVCRAGNCAPVALLLLGSKRQGGKLALPPQYFLSEGGQVKQQEFHIKPRGSIFSAPLGTMQMYASKPFLDNIAPRQEGRASARTSISMMIDDASQSQACSEYARVSMNVARKRASQVALTEPDTEPETEPHSFTI